MELELEREVFLKDLNDFIAQTGDSLRSIAEKLGWNTKKLLEEQRVVCPYKGDHLVSPGSFQKHTERCRLKSLGIDPDVEASTKLESSRFCYKDSERVVTIITGEKLRSKITESIEELTENMKTGMLGSSVTGVSGDERGGGGCEDTGNSLTSLVETVSSASMATVTPLSDPLAQVRYINSWLCIPLSHIDMPMSKLEPNIVKAWLVENLPTNQSKIMSASGEVDMINFIYSCLCDARSCEPDKLMKMLVSFFGPETRQFVLVMWKFLAEASVLQHHQLSEQDVTTARLLGMGDMKAKETPAAPDPGKQMAKLVKMATNISDQEATDEEIALSAESSIFSLSPSQRLALYDYSAQLASSKMEQRMVDIAQLQSQAAEAQELVTARLHSTDQPTGYLEQIAQRRDYRRRRQSYRARNTHITKRTSTEVMRDLIEAHMSLLETVSCQESKDEPSSQQQAADRLSQDSGKHCMRTAEHCSSRKRQKHSDHQRRSSGSPETKKLCQLDPD